MRNRKFSDIDVNQLAFSEPQSGFRGGQTVALSFQDEKIIIQTPRMRMPFGISSFQGQGYTSYSIDFSLQDRDDFKKFIQDLHGAVLNQAMLKRSEWFHSSSMARETIEEYFYSGIRDDPKGRYASTFKINLQIYDGKTKTDFFNHNGDEITFQDVSKGSAGVAVIELVGLWFQNKKFGLKWNVTQVKVFPDEQQMAHQGFMMIDDDDESSTAPAIQATKKTAYLLDSD